MAETATQRIARQLAERNNKAAGADTDEAPAAEDAADEEGEAEAEAEPTKPMTLKEKQALRKAKATQAATPDDDEEEDETSAPEEAIVAASKTTSTKSSSKAKPSASGKKPASPAQIAAREKFAAASRARAAERAGTTSSTPSTPAKAPSSKASTKTSPKILQAKAVVSKGRQTPEQIRAAQSAKRKADQAAAAEAASTQARRAPTGKPKVVQKPSAKAAAAVAKRDAATAKAAPKLTVIKGGKAKAEPKPAGETKTKVHALLAKGKTRREIMEALDLSYPSVLHHARSFEGEVASTRGSIFVKTNLDEEGNKLGKGKTEEVSRSEAMRRDFRSGMKIGDVARKHEVRYQIAYTAIRPIMSEGEE